MASWVSASSCTQCGQPHSTWPSRSSATSACSGLGCRMTSHSATSCSWLRTPATQLGQVVVADAEPLAVAGLEVDPLPQVRRDPLEVPRGAAPAGARSPSASAPSPRGSAWCAGGRPWGPGRMPWRRRRPSSGLAYWGRCEAPGSWRCPSGAQRARVSTCSGPARSRRPRASALLGTLRRRRARAGGRCRRRRLQSATSRRSDQGRRDGRRRAVPPRAGAHRGGAPPGRRAAGRRPHGAHPRLLRGGDLRLDRRGLRRAAGARRGGPRRVGRGRGRRAARGGRLRRHLARRDAGPAPRADPARRGRCAAARGVRPGIRLRRPVAGRRPGPGARHGARPLLRARGRRRRRPRARRAGRRRRAVRLPRRRAPVHRLLAARRTTRRRRPWWSSGRWSSWHGSEPTRPNCNSRGCASLASVQPLGCTDRGRPTLPPVRPHREERP